MQEEPQNQDVPQSTLETPAATSNTLMKDLMIPISIVIAGLAVGAGLYFGGGTAPGTPQLAEGTPPEPADNTAKMDPVTPDEHIRGNVDAPIKIVEYSDFDCPFCSRFHDTMNSVMEKYGEDEVAWVFRQFPLEQLHPQAPAVAVASECVAALGGNDAFWTFADGYFGDRGSGKGTPHAELVPALVASAGVDQDAFATCFEDGSQNAAVQSDVDDAVETGGRGTPWSIIVGPTGKTYPLSGALPAQAVEQLIEVARQEA